MIICGLKLTHDGSIAIIKDNELVVSIEMEKLRNNPRFTSIEETTDIQKVLESEGFKLEDIDHFVVDGWGGFNQEALAIQPRLEIGENFNWLSSSNQGEPFNMPVAQYRERTLESDVLEEMKFEGLQIGKSTFPYSSFLHVTGHLMGTYATSPFALRKENAYLLVWDGGMFPRLYFYDYKSASIENLGPIFLLIGNIYTIFSQHFGPFKVNHEFAKDSLSVAGKVMAYIALGKVNPTLFPYFEDIYRNSYDKPMGFANVFANQFKEAIRDIEVSDEDILCTFHTWLEKMLIEKLQKKIKRLKRDTGNLCLSGGCALNIKWNSAIRNSQIFDEVYVSPFPNDSGSAIGAAATKLLIESGSPFMNWSVYSGPDLQASEVLAGWASKPMDLPGLAELLHETNLPVVFLNGRAELGPRALGNRSIIGAPGSPEMKDILNRVKQREAYRPVSPICLESSAPEIFEPGTPDPYMLFDHQVRPEWLDRIQAVTHLDGSARLQTVNEQQNPVIFELLTAYKDLSGISMLCNTSANLKGTGFFPDVESAMKWGEIDHIWSDGMLYYREEDKQQVNAEAAMESINAI